MVFNPVQDAEAEVSELLEGGWREVERAISAAGATVGDGDINRLAFPY